VEAQVGIGETLAQSRGRAGLTVAQVAHRTRIREAVITAIERGDFAACGGDFYARGHIRSIATAVGTDPEPLISEYDAAHGASPVGVDELFSPAQPRGRRRPNWAAVLGVALLVVGGFAGYELLTGSWQAAGTPLAAASHAPTPAGQHGASSDPSPSRAATPHPSAPAQVPPHPAATVRAYIAAINGHHYARAWRLGGRNASSSYSSFAAGFSGTAHDTLTIMSVRGDVVTARLTAEQTDGTITAYQGTYTVQHGVITGFDVVQVG
jgi:cytoskeletal protein RodZ